MIEETAILSANDLYKMRQNFRRYKTIIISTWQKKETKSKKNQAAITKKKQL